MVLVSCSVIQAGQAQRVKTVSNRPPTILSFESSSATLTLCPSGMYCEPSNRKTVTLVVKASDPDGDGLTYHYSTTAGEILGEGGSVTWKLEGATFGSYVATVTVIDSKGAKATAAVKLDIGPCLSCGFSDPPCPVIVVTSPGDSAYRGEQVIFDVMVGSGNFQTRPDYIWKVTAGEIIKGQHTPRIEVEATGEVGQNVTATVEVGGLDRACSGIASYSSLIKQY